MNQASVQMFRWNSHIETHKLMPHIHIMSHRLVQRVRYIFNSVQYQSKHQSICAILYRGIELPTEIQRPKDWYTLDIMHK